MDTTPVKTTTPEPFAPYLDPLEPQPASKERPDGKAGRSPLTPFSARNGARTPASAKTAQSPSLLGSARRVASAQKPKSASKSARRVLNAKSKLQESPLLKAGAMRVRVSHASPARAAKALFSEDEGTKTLLTPVKASKKIAEELGTSLVLTPVRRSMRLSSLTPKSEKRCSPSDAPSRDQVSREPPHRVGIRVNLPDLLEETNFAYAANTALLPALQESHVCNVEPIETHDGKEQVEERGRSSFKFNFSKTTGGPVRLEQQADPIDGQDVDMDQEEEPELSISPTADSTPQFAAPALALTPITEKGETPATNRHSIAGRRSSVSEGIPFIMEGQALLNLDASQSVQPEVDFSGVTCATKSIAQTLQMEAPQVPLGPKIASHSGVASGPVVVVGRMAPVESPNGAKHGIVYVVGSTGGDAVSGSTRHGTVTVVRRPIPVGRCGLAQTQDDECRPGLSSPVSAGICTTSMPGTPSSLLRDSTQAQRIMVGGSHSTVGKSDYGQSSVGLKTVLTPKRASKLEKELLGSEVILTPARRSTRTPMRQGHTLEEMQNLGEMLMKSGFCYAPNDALIKDSSRQDAENGMSFECEGNMDVQCAGLTNTQQHAVDSTKTEHSESRNADQAKIASTNTETVPTQEGGDSEHVDVEAILADSVWKLVLNREETPNVVVTPHATNTESGVDEINVATRPSNAQGGGATDASPLSLLKRSTPAQRVAVERASQLPFTDTSQFGFKTVLTPKRATKEEKELLGSDIVLTPAKRSTRTPLKESHTDKDISQLLEESNYSYAPNAGIPAKPFDVDASPDVTESETQVSVGAPETTGDSAPSVPAVGGPVDSPSEVRTAEESEAEPEATSADSDTSINTLASNPAPSTPVSLMKQVTPARRVLIGDPLPCRSDFCEPSPADKGLKTVLTPKRASRQEKELLGSEVVLTPVRRSTRTPVQQGSEETASLGDMLEKSHYCYAPNAAIPAKPSAVLNAPVEKEVPPLPEEENLSTAAALGEPARPRRSTRSSSRAAAGTEPKHEPIVARSSRSRKVRRILSFSNH
eukprot:scaffold1399_cov410-Prasinococcus_capsulatus_cf.AAC.22